MQELHSRRMIQIIYVLTFNEGEAVDDDARLLMLLVLCLVRKRAVGSLGLLELRKMVGTWWREMRRERGALGT